MKEAVTIEDRFMESIDHLFDLARSGTAEQRKFFSGRKAKGLGVGLCDGKIVGQGGLDC